MTIHYFPVTSDEPHHAPDPTQQELVLSRESIVHGKQEQGKNVQIEQNPEECRMVVPDIGR